MPGLTPNGRRRAPGGRRLAAPAIAVVLAVVLTGCAPSPTTTYTDAAGRRVTVDWADYPGSSEVDASDVLAAPPREDVAPIAAAVLRETEQALTQRYGMRWSEWTEGGWMPYEGNGYGGRSMYQLYNSPMRRSDDAPTAPQDWRAVVDTVDAVAARHGLGPVELEHEQAARQARAGSSGYSDTLQQEYHSTDPDDFTSWHGATTVGAQWLMVELVDVGRDRSGRRAAEQRAVGLPPRYIALTYGGTAISSGQRAAFEHRLAPYAGLRTPPATDED